jgi:hypothetical protein
MDASANDKLSSQFYNNLKVGDRAANVEKIIHGPIDLRA